MSQYTVCVPITKMSFVTVEADNEMEAIKLAKADVVAEAGFTVEWSKLLIRVERDDSPVNYTCGKCKEHGGCSDKWCPVR